MLNSFNTFLYEIFIYLKSITLNMKFQVTSFTTFVQYTYFKFLYFNTKYRLYTLNKEMFTNSENNFNRIAAKCREFNL